jgi:glycosyltransferase involved in cell wall biosynthesis
MNTKITTEKIGIGIITYKRPNFFKNCYESIPWDKVDVAVIVNDGPEYSLDELGIKLNKKTTLIQHEKNYKLAKTKNDALRFLYEKNCQHIFIIEDDTVIVDTEVFNQYITASKKTGILHLNYGPGSPFNRVQDPNVVYDLHNRHLCKQDSPVNPRLIIDYGDAVKIALYTHTVAAFTYYNKKCLELAGFMDEEFNENAWEHVEHTYRIIKSGVHPPFWWFADLADSEKLIRSQKGAIDQSSIATETDIPWEQQEWAKKVARGAELYRKKHGHYPNQPPLSSKEDVIQALKKLKP